MGKASRSSNGGSSVLDDPRITLQMSVLRDLKRSEEIELSPRSSQWIEHLYPLLEAYNFSSMEIVDLVKNCDYNSDRIQAAVAGILEQAKGHEQGEWTQVKNRKQKKEEQIAKERFKGNSLAPIAKSSRNDARRKSRGGRAGPKGGRARINGNQLTKTPNWGNSVYPPTTVTSPNMPEAHPSEGNADNIDATEGESRLNSKHAISNGGHDGVWVDYSKKYVNKQHLSPVVLSCYGSDPCSNVELPPFLELNSKDSSAQSETKNKSWAARLVAPRATVRKSPNSIDDVKISSSNSPKKLLETKSKSFSPSRNVQEVKITADSNESSQEGSMDQVLPEIIDEVNSPQNISTQRDEEAPEGISDCKTAVSPVEGLAKVEIDEVEPAVIMPRHHGVEEVNRKGMILFGTVSFEEEVVNDSSIGIQDTYVDKSSDVATAGEKGNKTLHSNAIPNESVLTVPEGRAAEPVVLPPLLAMSNRDISTPNSRIVIDQQCQTDTVISTNVICEDGKAGTVSRGVYTSRTNNGMNHTVKYIGPKTGAEGIDLVCSRVDETAVYSNNPRNAVYPIVPEESLSQIETGCISESQHPPIGIPVNAFNSKQIINSTAPIPLPSNSVNAGVQTYVPNQPQRKIGESGGLQGVSSRGGGPANNYLRGNAAFIPRPQMSNANLRIGGGMSNNMNKNIFSQRSYANNVTSHSMQHEHHAQLQQHAQQMHQHEQNCQQHQQPRSESPFQHPRAGGSTVPFMDKTHSHPSFWYDQQQQFQQSQQQDSRTIQLSSVETSSGAEFSRNAATVPSAHQQQQFVQGGGGSHQDGNYNRPLSPLSTADAQSQTSHQPTSAAKYTNSSGKPGQSGGIGQHQSQHHNGPINHLSQQQQHPSNVYGTHPYSSGPPGLTPSGSPPGVHSQTAYNYPYPNMGYPPYNISAYNGAYNQHMIPQYGMMGPPFNDKGGGSMHSGYPSQYGMGYGDTFDEVPSVPYGNNANMSENMGYGNINNNSMNHYSASNENNNNNQGGGTTSAGSGSSSATLNSHHHSQVSSGGGDSQMPVFNATASVSGGNINNSGGSSNYGQTYGQNNTASSNGGNYSSTAQQQNAPPGFGGGGGYSQKDGRSVGSGVIGMNNNSNVPSSNTGGFYAASSNQNTSNSNASGASVATGGSSRPNNNNNNNNNAWDNHCLNQPPSQNQYCSSNSGNPGSGYGGMPYNNRGKSYSGASGQYSNGNYSNRGSMSSNNQNDGSQGYFNYGGYNQPWNIQGQYSQNSPGLGVNYYSGQQFPQHQSEQLRRLQ